MRWIKAAVVFAPHRLADRERHPLVRSYVVYIGYVVGSNNRQRKWSTLVNGQDYAAPNDDDDMDPESALLLGITPGTSRAPSPLSAPDAPWAFARSSDGTSGAATPVIAIDENPEAVAQHLPPPDRAGTPINHDVT